MNTYPGEHVAYRELLSIVAGEVNLEDRWAIVEWVRREMHAASPDQIEAMIERASVEISTRAPERQRRAVLGRLSAMRERVRELAWERTSVRGAAPGDLVDAMHEMIRVVDPALSTHLSGVGTLAASIAKCLGLEDERIGDVAIAGRLLDVGKISASGDEHAATGERVVRAIPALQRHAGWVRSHHERLDGSGFPDGLRAPDIPLEVRVLGVADAFVSMVSGVPYRAGIVGDAVTHLNDNAGTLYDPLVVAAFERHLGARRLRVATETAA